MEQALPLKESELPEADDGMYNDLLSAELNDRYLGLNVLLPQHGRLQEARIVSRKRTNDGKMLFGHENPNPLLDSRIYNVEFPDGGVGEFTTNTIAESLYSNLDDDDYSYGLIDGIVLHRSSPEAVKKEDGYYQQGGVRKKVITTEGREIRIKWRGGSTSWLPMKVVKEANPLELAEYVVVNKINDEPAFAWWIPTVLRTRKRMISRLKTHHTIRKQTKFGIIVPSSLEEARELDAENGNQLWEKATRKELDKVKIAFELLDYANPTVVRYV